MACDVVLGAQWGDEGKAKMVDSLASDYDIIVRFQGGSNAGHTVHLKEKKYVFHLIPSGILYPDKKTVLGGGVVVNLKKLVHEISLLKKQGVSFKDRFFISDRAFVVMPYHIDLDEAREIQGMEEIGTTKQGIGPAYMDKIGRLGIRIGDLVNKNYVRKIIEKNLKEKNCLFKNLYSKEQMDIDVILTELYVYYYEIKDYIIDTVYYLNDELKNKKKILFEGAQGVGLDLDFGTYPFVTSSNSSIAGLISGTGINIQSINRIIGVMKIYNTRVGQGPFPTKMEEESLQKVQKIGVEFGATTGRQRDCGWFDMVHCRFTIMISSITEMVITKIDVFDDMEVIKICVAYDIDGERVENFPSNILLLEKVKPIYKEFKGWMKSTKNIKKKEDLPKEAIDYIDFIVNQSKIPITYISNGADREDLIKII